MKIRLLSYNIRFGGVGRETTLAATIEAQHPDVVVLQEATRPGVVERLAALTGMTHHAAERGRSLAFMSRHEVAHHAWHRPAPCRHAFLELALSGSNARIFGVHLSAVHSNWTERRRTRELHATLEAITEHRGTFHALVGDFNTLAPGEKLDMRKLPRRLQLVALIGGRTIRWQTIQTMLDARYVDGFRFLNAGAAGYTFPTWDPHVRLDYVFVPELSRERLLSCAVVDTPIATASAASDHFPLLVELDL